MVSPKSGLSTPELMVPPDHLKQKNWSPGPYMAAALGPLLPHSVLLFSTYMSEAAQLKDLATNYMSPYTSLLPTLLQTTTAHRYRVNEAASSASHAPSHARTIDFVGV